MIKKVFYWGVSAALLGLMVFSPLAAAELRGIHLTAGAEPRGR